MSTTGPSLTSEYASTNPLQVRIDTHARHSEHPDDPVTAVLAALELTGEEALADIGCGDGRFLAHLAEHGHRGRLVGLDNSTAMVAAAEAGRCPCDRRHRVADEGTVRTGWLSEGLCRALHVG